MRHYPEAFDRTLLLESLGGDEDMLRENCRRFVGRYAKDMYQLGEALASRDVRSINRLALNLKAVAGSLVASNAVECAHALEKATREGWHAGIPELLVQFDTELELLMLALQNELTNSEG